MACSAGSGTWRRKVRGRVVGIAVGVIALEGDGVGGVPEEAFLAVFEVEGDVDTVLGSRDGSLDGDLLGDFAGGAFFLDLFGDVLGGFAEAGGGDLDLGRSPDGLDAGAEAIGGGVGSRVDGGAEDEPGDGGGNEDGD